MNSNIHKSSSDNILTILKEADRCVKCGLCLPYCPTYKVYRRESDSPRGRIALAQGLADNVINVDNSNLQAIDHCLECRACEIVCPSKVQYSKLFDAVIDEYPSIVSKNGLIKATQWYAIKALAGKGIFSSLLRLFYQNAPVRKVLSFLPGKAASRLAKYAPVNAVTVLSDTYAAYGEEKSHVALFTGCVSRTDQQTLLDMIRVLNNIGVRVTVPVTQTCCGALSLHSGATEQAKKYLQQNLNAFDNRYDAIVFTASGCGAMLKDYAEFHHLDESDNRKAKLLCGSVMDVCEFINQSGLLKQQMLNPVKQTVAVHLPCSLKNSLKQHNSTLKVLHSIPDLKVEPVSQTSCCGAGGTHMLSYPEQADILASQICSSVDSVNADILLTSNIGCAMHLEVNLKQSNMKQSVLHPVSIINMSLNHEQNKS